MATAKEHYDSHLGPIYSWMNGDFEKTCSRNRHLFDSLNLQMGETGAAIDLGCGHGPQAIALAERGFHVIAVDACKTLIKDLRVRAASRALPVQAVLADIAEFAKRVPKGFDVAVCMGDTLTHLPTRAAAAGLIRDVGRRLVPGGMFIVSLRDYVSVELKGTDRFIQVKSDQDRILTCFLEYERNRVRVHDLIQTPGQDSWGLAVSSYRKLRLSPRWVEARFTAAGLRIESRRVERGMVTLVGRAAPPRKAAAPRKPRR